MPVIGKGVAVFTREVGQTEYDQTLLSHRKIFQYICEHKSFEAEMEMRFHLLYNTNRYERESWEVYKMPQAEVMKKKNCLEFIG